MTDGITYRRTAEDPKRGMSLDELRRFLNGVHGLDLSGDARVHVTATLRGGIKRLEVRS